MANISAQAILNSISVINLAKITEQELHTMVNDINRNFSILAASAISKGPSGISPELSLFTLEENEPLNTYYDLVDGNSITTSKPYEMVAWQGAQQNHKYQALPVYAELYSGVDDPKAWKGIVTQSGVTNAEGKPYFIGDLSGWIYQTKLTDDTDEPIYSVRDAYPKLFRKASASGDLFTWMIDGVDTGINAMGYPGKDGTNANIYANANSPLSIAFPFLETLTAGDILFAPRYTNTDSDADAKSSDLWIWKYQLQNNVLQWTPIFNLTDYFPQNIEDSKLNAEISPRSVSTRYIIITSDINAGGEDKSGILFQMLAPELADGSQVKIKYHLATGTNNGAQLLMLKGEENYTSGESSKLIEYDFIPGLMFDNSINVFNLHLGDAAIDFEKYGPKELKTNNEDIFGDDTEIEIHKKFELYMNKDKTSRFLEIRDYDSEDSYKTRSFIRWKVV